MSTIQDLLGAEDEIFGVLHRVLSDAVPSVLPYAPKTFYQGVGQEDDENILPVDQIWVRASYTNSSAGQSTMSEQGHAKRWDRNGTLYVQFFSPIKDPSALRTAKELAILAQRAYEAAGSQCGMIFRDVRIDPVGPSESWFQMNLVARFEYEEYH